jgi:hypothetical protein
MQTIVDENKLLVSVAVANVICFDVTVDNIQRVQLQQDFLEVLGGCRKKRWLEPMVAELSAELDAVRANNDIESQILFDLRS